VDAQPSVVLDPMRARLRRIAHEQRYLERLPARSRICLEAHAAVGGVISPKLQSFAAPIEERIDDSRFVPRHGERTELELQAQSPLPTLR
jgi:hypothetical protein